MTDPESFGAERLLSARVEQRDGEIGISLEGELDISSAEPFEARVRSLASLAPGGIVLDLGGLTFLDSVGIRSLILLGRHLEEGGRTLALRNARGAVAKVLAMTGLAETV